MKTFEQLNIFGKIESKRIYKRNFKGEFSSAHPSENEIKERKLFKLENENEMLKRKVNALVRYQRILLTQITNLQNKWEQLKTIL